jgi:hypothetical protein
MSVQAEFRFQQAKTEVLAAIARGQYKGMDAIGQLLVQSAKRKAPVKRGDLVRSIMYEGPVNDGPWRMIVMAGPTVQYGAAQEFGSGLYHSDPAKRAKYPILPGAVTGKSSAKALAFKWPDGPRDHPAYNADLDMFFFAKVMHPGVRPQPYMRPALEDLRPKVGNIVLSAMIGELRRL